MKRKSIVYTVAVTMLLLISASTMINTTTNELSIELLSSEIKDGFLVADVCFDIPSNQDWVLAVSSEDIILNVGEEKVNIWAFNLLEEKHSVNGQKIGRCDRLFFQVNDEEVSDFSITFRRLVIPMAEQPDCIKAQHQLDEKSTGIVIECHHGENEFGFDILQTPESLTDNDARQVVFDIFNESLGVDWVLQSSIEKQIQR
ncbi:MAG: hypothetical protein Q8M94_11100 [Ignavibacteria bacterium]|nr:hypothetical protein [Ignavibacteria bacterium]